MNLPAGLERPAKCADGEHKFHEHEHGHVPAERKDRRCSGRWWCVRCKRWFDGELCGTGPRPFPPIPDPA